MDESQKILCRVKEALPRNNTYCMIPQRQAKLNQGGKDQKSGCPKVGIS